MLFRRELYLRELLDSFQLKINFKGSYLSIKYCPQKDDRNSILDWLFIYLHYPSTTFYNEKGYYFFDVDDDLAGDQQYHLCTENLF